MSGLSLKAVGWGFSPATTNMTPIGLYFHRNQKGIETKRSSWLLSSTPYCTCQAYWSLSDSPVECCGLSIYGRESAPFLKSAFLCVSYQGKKIESGKLVRRVAPLFTHICLVLKFILIFICVLRNKCDANFFFWEWLAVSRQLNRQQFAGPCREHLIYICVLIDW